ncbi:MAG: DcaP family trimeric outer membrane transporter [bacterium]
MKKTRIATALALVPLIGFSSAALSLTKGELESRVEFLEQELMALKKMVGDQGQKQKVMTEKLDRQPILSKAAGTTFDFGGFIKADAISTEYSDRVRHGGVGDDFFVPSLIAVGDGDGGNERRFDAHAKHSRIWFKTATPTDAGAVTSYVEMDFNSQEGDERLTNQVGSGLRHAFLKWDYSDTGSLLVGQTWSTFFNVGALPEAVDFIGPTSGTLFNRQVQLRWTKKLNNGGSFMLSAENPSSGFNNGGGGVDGNNYDDNTLPDLVARYNGSAGNLSYSIAAMARQIAYDSSGTSGTAPFYQLNSATGDIELNPGSAGTPAMDESKTGFALSLSGKYAFENGDDIKFMVNHGNLGRYIALNAFRDGVVEADGDIDLIDVTGGYIAYRHIWSDTLRSTFSYAMSTADNPSSAIADLTETVSNINVNLMYSPTKSLTFGAEYIYGEREVESGADGDMDRFQLMGKWAF